jgi:hypothetical protein
MLLKFMMQQQQQQQQLRASTPSQVGVLPTHNQAPVPGTASLPQSPARNEIPEISLTSFCQHYNVNAVDQERLQQLEFMPGDKISNLPEADWKASGFTALSWQRVIAKNNNFLRDARNGLWNV